MVRLMERQSCEKSGAWKVPKNCYMQRCMTKYEVNIQFVPFILRAWIIALSQSKYIRKKKCKINIWSLTHESFFLYEASNFTLSRLEYTLLYSISNDSLLCWNHLKSFLRGLCCFFNTWLGLSERFLRSFSINLITDKKRLYADCHKTDNSR